MKCPCGIEKNYTECCGVYHSGKEKAPTAEALMRSRYSAFAKNQMQYLRDTTDPQSLGDIDDEANQEWAERAKFLKLEIVKAEEKANKGVVEFKAFYSVDDEDYVHHEVSTFRKQAGEWFFKSGKVKETKEAK
ncbi:YchJ family metal-binding protein [Bdellovibrio sp. SKB1291214]|uniref:YchJ family protein n=1 Tax=Bdellovibrio sp. SKB1291214 TaxID=1732569 RepID=UPI000B51E084|nr:YchJ family metal-binding protein [Bdellovibrio sp. SKB1291214]UYL09375.1 YchJ family metal-binding protein [Bdellovibrio sp. SKB1291214]